MSDKNFNEWLFSDIDDLIDCDYSDESEAETRMTEIFETEIKCINRRANGKCNGGTDCCKCDLLMNEKDIISAYERAIANSNLINRLQAEIERLKECPKCIYEYDGKTTEYCVQGPCSNFKTVEQIKSEAYKEFAEKLENEINRRTTFSRQQDKNVIHIIHNLLKEMIDE